MVRPDPRKDALLGERLARTRRWRGVPLWAVEMLTGWPEGGEHTCREILDTLVREAEARSNGRKREQVIRDMRTEKLAKLLRDVSFSVAYLKGKSGTGVWVKNHVAPSETHESA